MSRKQALAYPTEARFPRVSGDEPRAYGRKKSRITFSPRERG